MRDDTPSILFGVFIGTFLTGVCALASSACVTQKRAQELIFARDHNCTLVMLYGKSTDPAVIPTDSGRVWKCDGGYITR